MPEGARRWSSGRQSAAHWLQRQVRRRGFEVRRHSASRRARLLADAGVDLVVDVGAAVGHYGQELRSFGYTHEIVSFEPMAEPFEALARAADSDPRWTARRMALGRTPGSAEIHVASNSDSSSLLPMLDSHRDAAPDIHYVGTESVTVSTLDAEFPAADVAGRRCYLKVDAQGFEREVLAGGPQFLEDCLGLQLELSFLPLYEDGPLIPEMITWAYDHGFTLMGFEQGFSAADARILQADGVFFRAGALA